MNIYKLFEFASYAIDIYLLVLSLRIMLSWFGGNVNPAGMQMLRRITDPFLNFFRRVQFMRIGFLDFSVLLGIFLLIFASNLLKNFALGMISLRITIYVLVGTVFSGISSVISIFIFIALFRLVGSFINRASLEALWQRLDGFLEPMVFRLVRYFPFCRNMSYRASLVCFLIIGGLIMLLFNVAISPLQSLINLIPF